MQTLVPWPIEQRPFQAAESFGRDAPLVVEIGFGNGEYLVRRAHEMPDVNLVGIENAWGSASRARRRVERAGLTNVRLLYGDAWDVLRWGVAPRSIDDGWCLFPCPWPKARHEKNRLFSRDFLRLLNSRLRDEAQFDLVTDHAEFRDWVLEQLPGTGVDVTCEDTGPEFETKYERKWRDGGQSTFYRLCLRKQEHQDVPFPEDVALEIRRFDQFEPDRFEPRDVRGEVTVAFKEFLYDAQRRTAMVRVVVAEPDLTQHVWITIVHDGRQWVVRPAQGSGMVPTRGMQTAIDAVREQAAATAS
jgi:tRNA (guanine-N7-)-methyltransferase